MTQQQLLITEEHMKAILATPDEWWSSFSWVEKSIIKGTIDTLTRIGNGSIGQAVKENFPDAEEAVPEAEETEVPLVQLAVDIEEVA